MKKHIILTATVLALAGLTAVGVQTAFAQGGDPASGLVQRIAEKFGLNQSEVQVVVDQYHQEEKAERQAEMKVKMEERLSQLVTDGKITDAQKQLILDKENEMQSNREQEFEGFKNMTEDERKATMEKHRTEMEAWAKENGIELKYLMPMHVKVFKHGPGGDAVFIKE